MCTFFADETTWNIEDGNKWQKANDIIHVEFGGFEMDVRTVGGPNRRIKKKKTQIELFFRKFKTISLTLRTTFGRLHVIQIKGAKTKTHLFFSRSVEPLWRSLLTRLPTLYTFSA